MLNTSFSPWPCYSEEEAFAIQKTLLSNKVNYWTGEECRKFEEEFAAWSDSKYAIALANGTVALDLAFKVLDIGPGDEVIVTSRTFLASVSSIVLCGATPVFADVDPLSQNISAETIRPCLSSKTKAIVAVHLAGLPCEMDPIMKIASERGLFVIEDCAQAHGARYKGRSVGSIGHIGAWSFCQDKIMTTAGEGGMVTTQDRNLWSKMWSYKDHGKSYEAIYEKEHPPGFRWVHESFGTNYRMTEIQAVIGRFQLRKMNEWGNKRRANAKVLENAIRDLAIYRALEAPDHCLHAQYKFYLFVNQENLKSDWSRDRILDEINQRGVPCYQGSCSEVYLEKAFNDSGLRPRESLPKAKLLGETSLMFLVHPTLRQDEIELAARVIREVGELAQQR